MRFGFSPGLLGTLLGAVIALGGPQLAQFVTAKKAKLDAETEHLKAQAEALKNPLERSLATLGVGLLPVAIDAASAALGASRDHVVSEVSRVNPQAGALVGTLIDTALATPPAPLADPPASPVLSQVLAPVPAVVLTPVVPAPPSERSFAPTIEVAPVAPPLDRLTSPYLDPLTSSAEPAG